MNDPLKNEMEYKKGWCIYIMLHVRKIVNPLKYTVKRFYNRQVIDHYTRNIGSLDKNKKNVGTGLVGAPSCGDALILQIEVDESGIVTDSKFKTCDCGVAIMSGSFATEWMKKKNIRDCLQIKNTDIALHLNLPLDKLHCATLVENAIKSAINDYTLKNTGTVKTY